MAAPSGNVCLEVSSKKRTWHWTCCSVYCKNSWRSEGVSYYRLTKVGRLSNLVQSKYLEVTGKKTLNWKKEVICSAHWSSNKKTTMIYQTSSTLVMVRVRVQTGIGIVLQLCAIIRGGQQIQTLCTTDYQKCQRISV